MTRTVDARGNELAVRLHDVQGRLTVTGTGNAGWDARFDARDDCVYKHYVDENGKRPARWPDEHTRYDDRGNALEIWSYTDEAGHPLADAYGRARIECTYDDRGHMLSRRSYGPEGKPVPGACAELLAVDVLGNVLERKQQDASGAPVKGPRGEVATRYSYDERSNVVEQVAVDDAGRPVPGAAREVRTYDERNQLLEIAYFTGAHEPAIGPAGCHATRRVLDRSGEPARTMFLDTARRELPLSLVITEVTPGMPAERLGLRAGDVIEGYAGKPVTGSASFLALRSRTATEPSALSILRGSARLRFVVPPGTMGVSMEERPARASADTLSHAQGSGGAH